MYGMCDVLNVFGSGVGIMCEVFVGWVYVLVMCVRVWLVGSV